LSYTPLRWGSTRDQAERHVEHRHEEPDFGARRRLELVERRVLLVQEHLPRVIEEHETHRPRNLDQVLGIEQDARVPADDETRDSGPAADGADVDPRTLYSPRGTAARRSAGFVVSPTGVM